MFVTALDGSISMEERIAKARDRLIESMKKNAMKNFSHDRWRNLGNFWLDL